MSDTDWTKYAACAQPRCNADPGEACADLRNWPLHYLDTRRVPAKHPHKGRPRGSAPPEKRHYERNRRSWLNGDG